MKRQSEGKDGYVDVDVFLGAQDVAREYKITGVECTKGDCLVSMAADWGNGQGYVPGVVVVVSREQGRWKIADIRYAGTSGSLLGELGLASAHMK